MAMFKSQYMIPYYIGEGLSGLLPGLMGLIQGVGRDPECRNQSRIIYNETTAENYTIYEIVPLYHPPLFDVEGFFVFLMGMLLVSGIAFTFLNFSAFCKKEMVSIEITMVEDTVFDNNIDKSSDGMAINSISYSKENIQGNCNKIYHIDEIDNANIGSQHQIIKEESTKVKLKRSHFVILLVTIAWVNCLTNGVLPSTQSFSSLPYRSV